MPYKNVKDLPDGVVNNLPVHGQEIYLAAFNSAWEEYSHDEERAHKVAWSAVKKKYVKDESDGHWKSKD
jgi:cation transport regulator